jgi:hypothetical protein
MRPDLRQPARQPTLLHCADRHTTTLWDLSRQIVAYWCAIANLSLTGGVARIRLTFGCSSGGSTVSIAGEIMPTLKQFSSVQGVKIYDPTGNTEVPNGPTDSIPECLEP